MTGSNRTAIVTGSSQGIGAAVVERLAKDGHNVVINYSGNASPADDLAAKIEATGGRAMVIKADISDPAAVAALFSITEQAFGGVDILRSRWVNGQTIYINGGYITR